MNPENANPVLSGGGSFKKCSCCGKSWPTVEEFLGDRENRLDGYQFDSRKVAKGLAPEGFLIFTHLTGGCDTSLAVPAEAFVGIGDSLQMSGARIPHIR